MNRYDSARFDLIDEVISIVRYSFIGGSFAFINNHSN